MKLNGIISAMVLGMGLLSCSNGFESVKGDPLDAQICTLDNGLRIYMTVNKETPRIQTYIAVKVGAKNDPLETTGLAHYFEHLMFKGSKSFGTSDYTAEEPMLNEIEELFELYRKNGNDAERKAIYHKIDSISYEASKLAIPNEYDKLMAMIGADGTNAWTSQDETVYVEDIPSNQIDNWARIQADRFRNTVIRGFHTELETIYEEKNMAVTKDQRKVIQGVMNALYPEHPYGIHDVLGFQEHLKNPSITNVKNYHDTWYVPNNMAICVSGDFEPKEMVAAIRKYFGDWAPNRNLPEYEIPESKPITSPVIRDVYGLEAENVYIAWPVQANRELKDAAICEIVSNILDNGQAGLLDLDLNKSQKVLGCGAFNYGQADHGTFLIAGFPRPGQSLEEVRELLLAEVAKLRSGDFDAELIKAAVNNARLDQMRALEKNRDRARMFIEAFINGVDWKDACRSLELLSSVTKEDVVAWAEKYLPENGYVAVNKRRGEDTTLQKIAKPAITPIVTNRDRQSEFLAELKNVSVKPIDPVFVDFSKDMEIKPAGNNQMLYKHNELNEIFNLDFAYRKGNEDDRALELAFDYLTLLGTSTMSAAEIASRMYTLGCTYSLNTGRYSTTVSLSGLGENMQEALALLVKLVNDAQPDEDLLEGLKANMLKARADAKLNQQACYRALTSYVRYGAENVRNVNLSDSELAALTSEELIGKCRAFINGEGCELSYYGPMGMDEALNSVVAAYDVTALPEAGPERFVANQTTASSKVVIAQYDAPQVYYTQFSCDGKGYDSALDPAIDMYNEYFGGGMNSIVFQEMREARGLAYSARAYMTYPSCKEEPYCFSAFIATQNDKVRTAVEAFADIIENMPLSEAAFNVAKESIIGRLRTQRTTGRQVFGAYRKCRRLGIPEPTDRAVFEAVQGMTLSDVEATQKSMVAGRKYTYAILGDYKALDQEFLNTLGPVTQVTLEEVFGY